MLEVNLLDRLSHSRRPLYNCLKLVLVMHALRRPGISFQRASAATSVFNVLIFNQVNV